MTGTRMTNTERASFAVAVDLLELLCLLSTSNISYWWGNGEEEAHNLVVLEKWVVRQQEWYGIGATYAAAVLSAFTVENSVSRNGTEQELANKRLKIAHSCCGYKCYEWGTDGSKRLVMTSETVWAVLSFSCELLTSLQRRTAVSKRALQSCNCCNMEIG